VLQQKSATADGESVAPDEAKAESGGQQSNTPTKSAQADGREETDKYL